MHRWTPAGLLVAGLAAAALAACGGNAAASTTSSQTAASNARGGSAVTGQLAQLSGSKLVISGQSGATNVTVSSSTRITQLTTGTVADIATGQCINATGTKDATGAVTATTVALTPKPSNGKCSQPAAGPGNRPSPGSRPRPSASPGAGGAAPRFSPPANFAAVRGEVTGVSGTSVTVSAASGGTQTVTLAGTTRVTRTIKSTTSNLAVGECIRATGQKQSSGTVKATTVAITPAGPNGCTFGGGGGRFGGGGFVGPGGGGQQPTQSTA